MVSSVKGLWSDCGIGIASNRLCKLYLEQSQRRSGLGGSGLSEMSPKKISNFIIEKQSATIMNSVCGHDPSTKHRLLVRLESESLIFHVYGAGDYGMVFPN